MKYVAECFQDRELSGLIQHGSSDASVLQKHSENLILKDFVNEAEISSYMKKADIVISHAGIGSILLANGLGKKLVLLPRLQKYEEHFDDHQLQISNYLLNYSGIFVSGESKIEFYSCASEAIVFRDTVKPLIKPQAIQDSIAKLVALGELST